MTPLRTRVLDQTLTGGMVGTRTGAAEVATVESVVMKVWT